MKKTILIAILFSMILIISTFPNVSASQYKREEIEKKIDEITKENKESKWFPGFIIFQLIKGAVALVLVLLILFDLIEPEEA